MLLLRFELNDLDKCKTVDEVFEAMGVGVKEDSKRLFNLRNEKIFGKKAYYKNMFIAQETYERVYNILNNVGKHPRNRLGEKLPTAQALYWCNMSPISNGPRFDKIKADIGVISPDTLYIVLPGNPLYEENPRLN